MQEEHELEMKAEELFNMTFGPLTWNPDDEDEAKDIVDCAVKDGLMAMPDAEDREAPFLLRERTTFVAAVMHSVIGFMQTGFEEAKASLSEDDFLLTDEDLDGDLREKAMAACMSIISAMVEQYEEDKNQTWN